LVFVFKRTRQRNTPSRISVPFKFTTRRIHTTTKPRISDMKLPITFEQFKSDPSKAIMFLLLGVVSVLYYRAEGQSKAINERCEKRLQMCEAKLDKLTKQLKTQDSLCSALVTEITIYKSLGKI
jgi:hypothetical protein